MRLCFIATLYLAVTKTPLVGRANSSACRVRATLNFELSDHTLLVLALSMAIALAYGTELPGLGEYQSTFVSFIIHKIAVTYILQS